MVPKSLKRAIRQENGRSHLNMPIVFRYGGFKFFFYSNEGSPREPIHIHVRKGDGEAKFWLNPIAVATSVGFDARTLRELTDQVETNRLMIERTWYDYFA
jgi:Domain of unknown function (DUF4160)